MSVGKSMTKPILPSLVLVLALVPPVWGADRDPPAAASLAARSGPHQLLCAQISSGGVIASSGTHRLFAVLDTAASARDPESERYRLRSSCLAGQYRRQFFIRIFGDSFGPAG